jgi:TP901 family phage tail tape measure protein
MARTFHLDTLIVRLAMDSSQFDASIERRLKRATTELERAAVKWTRMGRSLSLYVSTPLAAMGAIAVREFSRFNQAMTEAESIMGGVSDSVRADLISMAKSLALGGQVPFDPTELAKGFQELAAAGFDAEQSMAALPTVARFATAGAFGLSEAVRHLSDSMFAFGLMSDIPAITGANMERVANQLAFLANKTTISVREAAIAMKTDAAQQARLLSMSLEDLVGMIGAYAQAGKKAQNAGHMAGRAMRLLTDSYRKHGEIFEHYNIDVVDEATGKYHRFADIIEDMEKALSNMTDPEKIEALNALGFETLALKSLLPLIGMSKNMKEIAEEAGNATEVIETMAGIQMTSFQNQTKLTLNHLKIMGQEIGELITPALLLLYEGVRKTVDGFLNMSTGVKGVTIAALALVAGMGPAILMVGQFMHAINAMTITLGTARMMTLAYAGGLGLLAAALAIGIPWLYRIASAQNAVNKETERAMMLEQKRAKATRGRIGEFAATVRHMRPEEAEHFAKPFMDRALSEMDAAQKEISAKQQQIQDMVQKTLKLLTTDVITGKESEEPTGFAKWLAQWLNQKFIDNLETEIEAARQRLESAEEEANAYEQTLRDMGVGLEAAADAANKLEFDIEELNNRFEKSIKTIGMSSDQLRVWELADRGATDAQLAGTRAWLARLEAAEANAKEMEEAKRAAEQLSQSAKDASLSFAQQTAALTRSSEEMTVWKLHADGLRGAEFEMIRAAAMAAEAARKHHEILEEGKGIIEKYRTPLEKLRAEQKRLLELRAAGAFRDAPNTFRRAWEDAIKTFKEARSELERPIRIGGDDFSGVAGSAEHLKRVEEYRNALVESKRRAVALAKVAPPGIARPGAPGRPAGAVPGAPGAPVVSRGREAVDRSLAAHYARIEGLLATIAVNTSNNNVVKLDTLGVEELV